MRKTRGWLLSSLPALYWIIATPSAAEVLHQSESGFAVRDEVTISAPADQVWTALTDRIGSWWHPDHTYTGDAGNLSIDPSPGGCFCEALPGGGVQHLEVVYADEARLLRLSGGLGPLQEIGASGTLALTLTASETGESTRASYSYAVHGHLEGGLGAWAAAVDGVLSQQLERLGRFVETGDAETP